jgi:hypothetical protein
LTLLVEITLVAVAAIGVAVCVALLPNADRGRWGRRPPVPTSRPAQLEALESIVVTSRSSALSAHAYLRPLLAKIVLRRLAARGRSLQRLSDRGGAELLGEDLWEFVRPGRPFPEDRYGPGISPRDLDAMLDTIEAL